MTPSRRSQKPSTSTQQNAASGSKPTLADGDLNSSNEENIQPGLSIVDDDDVMIVDGGGEASTSTDSRQTPTKKGTICLHGCFVWL